MNARARRLRVGKGVASLLASVIFLGSSVIPVMAAEPAAESSAAAASPIEELTPESSDAPTLEPIADQTASFDAEPGSTTAETATPVQQPVSPSPTVPDPTSEPARATGAPTVAPVTSATTTPDPSAGQSSPAPSDAPAKPAPVATVTAVPTTAVLQITPYVSGSSDCPGFRTNVTPGTASGNVQVFDASYPGGPKTLVRTSPLSNGTTNTTQCWSLDRRTHFFSTHYVGSASYLASDSQVVPYGIGATAVTAELAVDRASVYVGDPVQLTARLSTGPAAGTVTFRDAKTGNGIAQAEVDATGVATAAATMPAGSYNVYAAYSSQDGWASTESARVAVQVAKRPTTLTLPEPAAVYPEDELRLTATLDPAPDGGQVTFFLGTGPGAGSATVDVSPQGTAEWTGTLPAGLHSITASYSGSATYAASSATTTATIRRHTTALTLTLDPAGPLVTGQRLDFQVVAEPVGIPEIRLYATGATGEIPLGVLVPDSSGVATFRRPPGSPASGIPTR